MKPKEILDRIFQQFFRVAKNNLQKDGYLTPCIFFLKGSREQPDIADMVEMRFKTDEEKELIAKYIEELIRRTGAWGYLMVNEVWLLDPDDFPDKKLPGISPSRHPKRREAVWVALFTYDYHRGSAVLFERKGERIVLGKEITMEPEHEFAGRFAQMLPPMS